MVASAELLTEPLTEIFVGYDKELFSFTVDGFRIFALSFMFMGFAIFGSSFFTALIYDGLTSAIISFLRTFSVSACRSNTFAFNLGDKRYLDINSGRRAHCGGAESFVLS